MPTPNGAVLKAVIRPLQAEIGSLSRNSAYARASFIPGAQFRREQYFRPVPLRFKFPPCE